MTITYDVTLGWRDIAAIAAGETPVLGEAALRRIADARAIVDALIEGGIRTYGLNTGVGAFHDVLIDRGQQRALSRNIVLSHAVGVGAPLGETETRAIMAAQLNMFAHGHSGVRPRVAEALLSLIEARLTPRVPAEGSVGYLSHMAHIGLALIGEGQVCAQGERLAARVALERHGLEPIELEAKEGLSIVNGAPCATGLAALALARGTRLLDWADALAACSFEALGGQIAAFDAEAMALHRSPGLNQVAARLRARLAGSLRLNGAQGRHTQDALSLRAVPQVHGAARDAFAHFGQVIDRELASVSDNPVVLGTPDRPRVVMEAHAVAAGVGLAMDGLAVALGEVAGMAERRLDRLVNPLISGLPPFLAARGGLQSGFMIAQYTAVALAADNRRRAAPASLDGGVTSGLQEDHLAHATPASLKALKIVDNAAQILAIEALAAAQASDLVGERRAAGTEAIHARLRRLVPPYADDRPLGDDLAAVKRLLLAEDP